MKNFLCRGALIAIALFPLCSVHAAYDAKIVGADARWIVYVDLDSLRASTLGKELVTAIEKQQTMATGGMIGVDIPKLLAMIGSLTAYGTNLSAKPEAIDGTMIVQGTGDLRKIAESLLLQGTIAQPAMFSEVTDLPFPAYAISNPHEKIEAKKMQVVIAFPPEPIVLVSKSKSHLLQARDVFRGAAPSLAKTPASPLNKLAGNAQGAIVFAGSVVPSESLFASNAPQARMLQLTSSGSVALGERGENTFAHVEMLASTSQNAEKLMKILQGTAAMLSLAETNDHELAAFLQSTKVGQQGDAVTLDLAYSSARLVKMVQSIQTSADATPRDRQPRILIGRSVDEWGGSEIAAPSGTYTGEHVHRTIEKVALAPGQMISLGRSLNGGKNARFIRVNITPAAGGSPLTFGTDFMRNVRGNIWQFQFPGAEGDYNLDVTYVEDPEGKAKFAVSIADPQAPAEIRRK